MESIKTTLQTILNFIALDRILNPIAGSIIPVSVLGVFLSFLYWGGLLLIAYLVALFLKSGRGSKMNQR